MSEPTDLKYRAFISYSHADTSWAKWLHRGLEAFHIDKDLAGRVTATGPIPQALRPIFRDRDEFTAGHALAEQTLAALDDSHALIVVCSPASAKSRYVNEELRLFKSRHPERAVIPLIVAGKPGDPKFECFPPALSSKLDASGQITAEPDELLAADAQEEGDGKNLALAKVVAGLLGVSSDEIFRRAERERRAAARRRRRVQVLIAGLGVLLIVGLVGWINQDYLKEQYLWRFAMKPSVLSDQQERALAPGNEFAECASGCPAMVVVPAGSFTMGSPEAEGMAAEHPAHDVVIAKPFAIGKYEVTFAEWDVCVAAGGCPFVADSNTGRGQQPATTVKWEEAQRYTEWLSRLTGKRYRLPTEAEWEYAARAGSTTRFPFGDDPAPIGDYAWYLHNSASGPRPVGTRQPNRFGLYDMIGNVGEIVEDKWHFDYVGAPSDGTAWSVGTADAHVLRGGCYIDSPDGARSASRVLLNSASRFFFYGFRIARTLAQ
jgi:formylglycine-generating enzyme required for sulfatase activity